MPPNYIQIKCTGGYKFTKSQEKLNDFMYMDYIKIFAKNEKELETFIQAIRIFSQDLGMEFGLKKCAMLIMKKEKKEKQWEE